ncbi:MAG: sulfite exporter TauE/SafE family protein [Candidatus Aenigmarchaeota archaeon]|nr:sulfite exporter TauE/SafE family protein [Candidatus Aenigmarchaeota archaeon]
MYIGDLIRRQITKNKQPTLTEAERKFRTTLVISAFVLFIIVLFGFIYVATTPATTATLLLSFAGGISNIVLPCTLPLVFIIVPLAMVAGRKGLLMTLFFGLGLVITLSVYGGVIAEVGKYLGLDSATRIMYSLAGLASLIFGLSELKLIRFSLPSYAGMPQFIQNQGDYIKVFLLGLLLGNAGVGCPNPITYVILTLAATTGDIIKGIVLMAMNGIGRVVPLLLLTALGMLGINYITWLTKRIQSITKFTAWALIALGSFILLNGLFGHLWYEGGIFHEGLNAAFMSVGGKMLGEADIPIEEIEEKVPFVEYGSWANLVITTIPVFWYWRMFPRARKEVLIVLLIFLIWNLMLFNFGLDAMGWLGL